MKGGLKKGIDTKVLVQSRHKFWADGHEPQPPQAGEVVGTRSTCTMSYTGTLREGGTKL
jgi:hypothetical protein